MWYRRYTLKIVHDIKLKDMYERRNFVYKHQDNLYDRYKHNMDYCKRSSIWLYGGNWNNIEEDLKEYSSIHKDMLFIVEYRLENDYNEGEFIDFFYKTYAKNGKVVTYEGKLVYTEFKESDLK